MAQERVTSFSVRERSNNHSRCYSRTQTQNDRNMRLFFCLQQGAMRCDAMRSPLLRVGAIQASCGAGVARPHDARPARCNDARALGDSRLRHGVQLVHLDRRVTYNKKKQTRRKNNKRGVGRNEGGSQTDGAVDLFAFCLFARFPGSLSGRWRSFVQRSSRILHWSPASPFLFLRADWLLPTDTRCVVVLRSPRFPFFSHWPVVGRRTKRRPKPNAGRVYLSAGRGLAAPRRDSVRAKEGGDAYVGQGGARAAIVNRRAGWIRKGPHVWEPGQGHGGDAPRETHERRQYFWGNQWGDFFVFGDWGGVPGSKSSPRSCAARR